MARWTDKPAISIVDDADLLLVADVSEPVGTRDRTMTMTQARQHLAGGLIPRGDTASRPSAPASGFALLYWDSTLGKVIVHDGTTWVNVDGTSL